MRSGAAISALLSALLLLYACGSDAGGSTVEDDESDDNGSSDDEDDEDDDEDDESSETSNASARDGGKDAGGSKKDSGPAKSTDAGGKKDSGTMSARDSGSNAAPDTGSGSGSVGDDDDDDDDVSVGGAEPVIPEPSMECPVLKSGTNTIMGLSVEIVAGTPGAKKGPLVFNWHGTGGTGSFALGLMPQQIKDDIVAQGGIIVAPTDTTMMGTDVTFLLGVWYTPGDFEFADLVAACAVKNHNIDPRRIYATGCSAGGLAAGVMAFHRSSYIAASNPNSGGAVGILPGMTTLQDRTHVPAMMTMHGARGNDVVGVEFADTSQQAVTAIAQAGGFAVNCDHGGGHCMASAELQIAGWQFMKDHPFGVSPEPYANGLPSNFPDYCKIIE